jgi:hypothetical protein
MFKKRGKDLTLLRKTQYWNGIEKIIETDLETQIELVEYVYTHVCQGIIKEHQTLLINLPTIDPQLWKEYIENRIKLFEGYMNKPNEKIKNKNQPVIYKDNIVKATAP